MCALLCCQFHLYADLRLSHFSTDWGGVKEASMLLANSKSCFDCSSTNSIIIAI